jgi:hypothetical protein
VLWPVCGSGLIYPLPSRRGDAPGEVECRCPDCEHIGLVLTTPLVAALWRRRSERASAAMCPSRRRSPTERRESCLRDSRRSPHRPPPWEHLVAGRGCPTVLVGEVPVTTALVNGRSSGRDLPEGSTSPWPSRSSTGRAARTARAPEPLCRFARCSYRAESSTRCLQPSHPRRPRGRPCFRPRGLPPSRCPHVLHRPDAVGDRVPGYS